MKVLVALFSCSSDIAKGHNQAVRDTWGKNLPPNVDLRFLLGAEQPGPLEKENPSWYADFLGYSKRKPRLKAAPPPLKLPLLPDELALPAPDGYFYLTHKLVAALRWADQHEYDFVFRADTDTFVHIPHLLGSGFSDYDYVGARLGEKPGYAHGGPGFWLSRKAYRLLLDAPITIAADDVWVGEVLKRHNVFLHHDNRYCWNWRRAPKDNMITAHLSPKSGTYDNRLMHKVFEYMQMPATPPEGCMEVIVQGRHMWIPRPKSSIRF